ncbi:hypothetical protein B0O99DRAFT_592884 [Bisporella sp. PMI_857]|nr:hypothetical protein B0O99DRAFT_592884 [Bisporella sp. PMI_857]
MAPRAGSQQKDVTSAQRKPLCQKLGTEIVNIIVGEEKKKFVLHKNLICTSSPVFERMFNGSFKEGKAQTAKLPDDDVESFALFQGWLYNETIEHSNITEGDGNFTGQMVKLFLFTEKYDIVRLEDKTMDTLLAGKNNNIIPSLAWITKGYKNTRKGSVLRLYLSRAWVWVTMTSEEAAAWKNEGLAKA